MDEDTIADLKQFIAATVSQATANLATKGDVESMHKEMVDGFAGVGDAIEGINNKLDQRDAHDTEVDNRLTKLGQQTA